MLFFFIILHITLSGIIASKMKKFHKFYSTMTIFTLIAGYIFNLIFFSGTRNIWTVYALSLVMVIAYIIHTFLVLDKIKKSEDKLLVVLNLFMTVAVYTLLCIKLYEMDLTFESNHEINFEIIEPDFNPDEKKPPIGSDKKTSSFTPQDEKKPPMEQSYLAMELYRSLMRQETKVEDTKILLENYLPRRQEILHDLDYLFWNEEMVRSLFHRDDEIVAYLSNQRNPAVRTIPVVPEFSLRTELQRRCRDVIYHDLMQYHKENQKYHNSNFFLDPQNSDKNMINL